MKKLITSIAFLYSALIAFGQIDRSQVPEPGPAPEINIADPEIFNLDNGMKVILSSNHDIPKVSFNLVMGSDPRLEGDKAGLAEFMGDMLLSGTSNRSKDELDQEKDFIGASLGASSSNIYLSCLTKHMDKGLELMTDVMKNANFPKDEFERIKKQYESNLLSVKTNPDEMAKNAMSKAIFPENHPYGEIMTESSLENIQRKDLVGLFKKQFTPAGSYLVIVGDIDRKKAEKIANERFGKWEGGVPFEEEYSKGYEPKGNRVIFVEKQGAVQSVINVAFPLKMTPGHPDQIKMRVLNKLFGGGGFGTRLMQNLREDKAYTYGAYSRLNVNREGSWLSASGNFRNEVTDSAITQFLYEFQRITEEPVNDEELTLNKSSLSGSFARSLESPRTIANFALNIFRNDLPSDYYQTYLKKLNAVDKEDVLKTAQEHFTPNNMNIIVVGSSEVLDKIKQFDADGEIEVFDAFGNPSKQKEYRAADLAPQKVLEEHLIAITESRNIRQAKRRIGRIKNLKKTIEVEPQGSPMKMTAKQYYAEPNKEFSSMQVSGMEVQKQVFNGKKGMAITMNQTGGKDTTYYSDEKIQDKKKTAGIIPELGLMKDTSNFELLGLDSLNGNDYYVIEYTQGESTTRAFYNTSSFMKEHTEKVEVNGDDVQTISAKYKDFHKHKRVLFAHKIIQIIGSTTIESTVKNIEVNVDIEDDKFNVE